MKSKVWVKTTDELNQLSSQIDGLLRALFKTPRGSFEKELEKIGIENSENLKELFLKNKLDLKDKELVKDFLEKLKQEFNKLKIVKLVTAFEPSTQIVNHIHDWILSNLGAGFILDISFDETILGGAIVSFKGEYRDLTVKKKLQDLNPQFTQ